MSAAGSFEVEDRGKLGMSSSLQMLLLYSVQHSLHSLDHKSFTLVIFSHCVSEKALQSHSLLSIRNMTAAGAQNTVTLFMFLYSHRTLTQCSLTAFKLWERLPSAVEMQLSDMLSTIKVQIIRFSHTTALVDVDEINTIDRNSNKWRWYSSRLFHNEFDLS